MDGVLSVGAATTRKKHKEKKHRHHMKQGVCVCVCVCVINSWLPVGSPYADLVHRFCKIVEEVLDHMDQTDPGTYMYMCSGVWYNDDSADMVPLPCCTEFLLSRGTLSQLATEAARLKQLAVLHQVRGSIPHVMQRY